MQVARRRKIRILRTLNSQHFHSALCNLWITLEEGTDVEPAACHEKEREARILQLDITHILVHAPQAHEAVLA
jgi:hypothetical protein